LSAAATAPERWRRTAAQDERKDAAGALNVGNGGSVVEARAAIVRAGARDGRAEMAQRVRGALATIDA